MDVERIKLNTTLVLVYGIFVLSPTVVGWSVGGAVGSMMGTQPAISGIVGAVVGFAAGCLWVVGRGWRFTGRFKALEKVFLDITKRVNSLSVKQAEEAFVQLVGTSPVVETTVATMTPELTACHPDVVSLFQRFDRVALRPPNRKNPSVLLEPSRVQPLENNPEGMVVGRGLIERHRLVVCTATGRAVACGPPFKTGGLAILAADPDRSSPSVWHYLLTQVALMELAIKLRKKGLVKELKRMARECDRPGDEGGEGQTDR